MLHKSHNMSTTTLIALLFHSLFIFTNNEPCSKKVSYQVLSDTQISISSSGIISLDENKKLSKKDPLSTYASLTADQSTKKINLRLMTTANRKVGVDGCLDFQRLSFFAEDDKGQLYKIKVLD